MLTLNILDPINSFCGVYRDLVQFTASGISIGTFLVGWYLYFRHKKKKKVSSLQNGKYHFRIKRKNFNSTDLTTIVSNLYFNGGIIPGELRQEIFKITGTEGEKIEDK